VRHLRAQTDRAKQTAPNARTFTDHRALLALDISNIMRKHVMPLVCDLNRAHDYSCRLPLTNCARGPIQPRMLSTPAKRRVSIEKTLTAEDEGRARSSIKAGTPASINRHLARWGGMPSKRSGQQRAPH